MRRTLRGTRYLPGNEALGDFLVEDLFTLDMSETLEFYERIMPTLGPDGLALMGCNDRFFLFVVLLRRYDAMHPWLFERCREVEADPDGYLDLWAREHYKSSLITFAGVIQEILCDPEITVGIFSYTQALARAFVKQIKGELERNEDLKGIYADVLFENPAQESPTWTNEAITVRRRSNPKEATLEGWGLVTGMPTGRHFRLRVYDDVVVPESVTNPEMVKKTTEAWELSDNLGADENRRWHIGTRYSYGDTYGVIFERGILKPRLYPATDNGRRDGVPVFFSPEKWADKVKTQASSLSAQMLQNPLAGTEATFLPTWFRPYEARPKTLTVYIMCDPSKGTGPRSDRTAIAVVGIDSAGNKYLLDGYRHRMKLSERWAALKNLYLKWTKAKGVQLVSVGYERYGQQTDDEYFQERMRLEEFSFPIVELNWTRDGRNSKKDRVERLEPDFRQGRFFLPGVVHVSNAGPNSIGGTWRIDEEKNHVEVTPLAGPTRLMRELERAGEAWRIVKPIVRMDETKRAYDVTRALMEEMQFFPFGTHDDLVDAVSRIYDMTPVAPSIHELPAALDEVLSGGEDYPDT